MSYRKGILLEDWMDHEEERMLLKEFGIVYPKNPHNSAV
jgi:hypothetical protein